MQPAGPRRRTRRELAMMAEWLITGLTTLGILVYLVYSLLRPEKF
jgi:K+-transporting ATPase KdpF subunit